MFRSIVRGTVFLVSVGRVPHSSRFLRWVGAVRSPAVAPGVPHHTKTAFTHS